MSLSAWALGVDTMSWHSTVLAFGLGAREWSARQRHCDQKSTDQYQYQWLAKLIDFPSQTITKSGCQLTY